MMVKLGQSCYKTDPFYTIEGRVVQDDSSPNNQVKLYSLSREWHTLFDISKVYTYKVALRNNSKVDLQYSCSIMG